MNRFEKMKEMRTKIHDLLQERPDLAVLQKELNDKLSNVKDQHERNRIVQEMMLNSWYRITELQ